MQTQLILKYMEFHCENIWESSPLPWLGQAWALSQGSRRCSRKQEVAWRWPLERKFNFSTVKTDNLPSPLTISTYRPGTTNYIEQLYPTLWPPRKREETPPPAPASQTRERLIQDMALTWQGGREFRKLNGWVVKELDDLCQNQRTYVHLQMHWARSMPLINDNLILASLTFRFSGWRWAHSTYCRHAQDVFKHFDKNGDQLLSAPEMLSFVTCRCGWIGGFWASGDHDKMLRLWNNYGSGKPSHRLSAIISHLPGMTETWKAVPGELCGIWR